MFHLAQAKGSAAIHEHNNTGERTRSYLLKLAARQWATHQRF